MIPILYLVTTEMNNCFNSYHLTLVRLVVNIENATVLLTKLYLVTDQ